MKTWSIAPLFVQPIASTEIEVELSTQLKTISEDAFWFAGDGNAYITSKDMQILDKHKDLRSAFKEISEDLITQLGYDCEMQITTSWIHKLPPGDQIYPKTIYNSWYTGMVFFDEYTEESGDIEFFVDPQGVYVVPAEWSQWTAPSIRLTPNSNYMMMFPSYVRHRVYTNTSDTDRLCLMFNVMPKGQTGSNESTFVY